MDTPALQRGLLYTTHMVARCPSFSKCVRCQGCSAYNPHALQCTICERQKLRMNRCTHTEAQKLAVVLITEKLRRPMFDGNVAPQTMELGSIMGENSRLESLMRTLPGNVKLQQDVEEERWVG